MIYVEYERIKSKYQQIQAHYDAILSEQEELFARTQPKAANCESERVTGGNATSPFEDYIIAKEHKRIDERLNEAKGLLYTRKEQLQAKGAELRASKEWDDVVYRLYYLNRATVRQIERQVPYSRRQIYRILNEIRSNIKGL